MPLVVRDRADERRWPILTYVILEGLDSAQAR
jgi:hypothetical protein